MENQPTESRQHWRKRLFTVIFESDTYAGKLFDVVLLVLILVSMVLVVFQSTPSVEARFKDTLYYAEWVITILFSIEYLLRLLAVKMPLKYANSFYGIIDLLLILPSYLSFFFPQVQYLLVIRSLRLMRVFRIFKLTRFVRESLTIVQALKASSRRILVFLFFVLILCIILGSMMYAIEGPYNEKFDSIPQSVYWAIVTITTVGYGDISPVTPMGKMIASLIMLLGYAIIAVPTGIVTVELTKLSQPSVASQSCPNCSSGGHDPDARFCKYCGHSLES